MNGPIAIAIAGCPPPRGLLRYRRSSSPPLPRPRQEGGTRTGPLIGTQSAALGDVRQPAPPTRVVIPTLGVDVSVQPVGIQPDGLMELPPNVAIAGWYKYGSDPGSETGTTVISAHVDSLDTVSARSPS